jgi:hypothetical protein
MTKELEAAMLKVETFLDRTKLVSSSPTDGEIAAIEMLVTALATPAEPVCDTPFWNAGESGFAHRCILQLNHDFPHEWQPIQAAK